MLPRLLTYRRCKREGRQRYQFPWLSNWGSPSRSTVIIISQGGQGLDKSWLSASTGIDAGSFLRLWVFFMYGNSIYGDFIQGYGLCQGRITSMYVLEGATVRPYKLVCNPGVRDQMGWFGYLCLLRLLIFLLENCRNLGR